MQLRNTDGGVFHWCPGCNRMHIIPNTWQFDGNLTEPTFIPSIKHQWDEGDQHIHKCCHYTLIKGVLQFCSDCTHSLKDQKVVLPDLP